MKIDFHPEAEDEFHQAIRYYRFEEGSGERFTLTVQETLDQISDSPKRWRFEKDIRRCLCPIYPYAILYALEQDFILVSAVMHLHRDPDYWRSRIDR